MLTKTITSNLLVSLVIAFNGQAIQGFSFNAKNLKDIKENYKKNKKKVTDSVSKVNKEKDKLKKQYDKIGKEINEKKDKFNELKSKINENENLLDNFKTNSNSNNVQNNEKTLNIDRSKTSNDEDNKIMLGKCPIIISENLQNEYDYNDYNQQKNTPKKHIIMAIFLIIILISLNVVIWIIITKKNIIIKELKIELVTSLTFIIIINFFIMLYSNIFENYIEFTLIKDILLLSNTFLVGILIGKTKKQNSESQVEIP